MATLGDFMERLEKMARRRGQDDFIEYLLRDIDDPDDWERRLAFPMEKEADFIKFVEEEIEIFYAGENGVNSFGTIMQKVVKKICTELKFTRSNVM